MQVLLTNCSFISALVLFGNTNRFFRRRKKKKKKSLEVSIIAHCPASPADVCPNFWVFPMPDF